MTNNALLKTLTAVAAGAAAMYFLDSELGARRRGMVKEKFAAASHSAGDMARQRSRQVADRARSWFDAGRRRLGMSFGSRGDSRLHGLVCERLENVVAYPKAIDVEVEDGRVRLSGHVLAKDLDLVVTQVNAIPGVHGIDNGLMVHAESSGVPELQGDGLAQQRFSGKKKALLSVVAVAAPVALMIGARTIQRRRGLHSTSHLGL